VRSRDGDKAPAGLVVLDGRERVSRTCGRISLVGAGPGDPELLTFKAARLLGEADVVVYDRLVGEGVLDLIRPEARRLYVGKRKSRHSVPQDEVNRLLVALALQGLKVVRLKGGDPFLFGRGGEEMLAAREAGVPCDVVPGVTAGLAASAALQAPATHRGLAQAVTFVTGHAASGGEPDLDWPALARPNHTVIVYMGVTTAAMISARLIAAGRSPKTPVAIAQNVSRPDESRHATTLIDLPAVAAELDGPAILIIGESAALAATVEEGPAADRSSLNILLQEALP
jgi:uroporphyrin-III C-methyltransferase